MTYNPPMPCQLSTWQLQGQTEAVDSILAGCCHSTADECSLRANGKETASSMVGKDIVLCKENRVWTGLYRSTLHDDMVRRPSMLWLSKAGDDFAMAGLVDEEQRANRHQHKKT